MDVVSAHRRLRRAAVVPVLVGLASVVGACGGEEPVVVPAPVEGQVTALDSAQGRQLIDQGGALVVDVRTVEEYRSGHLVGAQSIPIDDAELWLLRTEPLDRDRPTVIYCGTGTRCETAAQQLIAAGFTKVYDLGGVEDWDSEDLRVEAP
jgi:rhodanese-related sulfurtransferase